MKVLSDAKEVADYAAHVVRSHMSDPAYRVFVFGSRATGTAHERSDIDIGIDGPQPVAYDVLSAIREELDESPTLYSIDVVDFARVPEKFRNVARERVMLV